MNLAVFFFNERSQISKAFVMLANGFPSNQSKQDPREEKDHHMNIEANYWVL